MSTQLELPRGRVGVVSLSPPSLDVNNATVVENEVRQEGRRGSWDVRSSTTTSRRISWSDSSDCDMTQECDSNSSFGGRRSLAAIFGSLGKSGKQRKAVTSSKHHRKVSSDRRKSHFYIDLPQGSTLVSVAPHTQGSLHTHTDHQHADADCPHPHTTAPIDHTNTEDCLSRVGVWGRDVTTDDYHTCTSSGQQQAREATTGSPLRQGPSHVRPSDAGQRRSKTHLGVLVIPDSLCESSAYRLRASAAQRHHEDSNMGLGFSKEDCLTEKADEVHVTSHTVPAAVTSRYVSVLAELTQRYATILHTRNCDSEADNALPHPHTLHTVRSDTVSACTVTQRGATCGHGDSNKVTVDGVTGGLVCDACPVPQPGQAVGGDPSSDGNPPPGEPCDIPTCLDQSGDRNRTFNQCSDSTRTHRDGDQVPKDLSVEDGVAQEGEECGEGEAGGVWGVEEGPALVKQVWTLSSAPPREGGGAPVPEWGVGEVSAATLAGTHKDGTSATRVSEEGGEVVEDVCGRLDGAKTDRIPSLQLPDPSVCDPPSSSSVLCDTNPLTHSPDLTPTASPDLTSEDKRDRKIFLIAQEVMTSERVFVDILKLLNVEFRKFVLEWREEGGASHGPVIPEDDLARILNYLPQLQNLNEEILKDLEVRITDWDRHKKISDVIVRKGPFLKLYSAYIKEFESQCDHLDHCCDTYPLFSRAVKQFETSKRCAKLNLKHYMLKPVQRIPQYRLLLEEYLKRLPESSPDYVDTQTALAVVANVAAHANDTMKQGTNFMKLLALQDRLSSSSSSSSSSTGDHDGSGTRGPRYELVRPGRYLLKEGELLKLCRREMQARYFILLSDVLLYTSFVTSGPGGALRLNYELPLEGMKVVTPKAEDFKNEFSIISTSRSFTLQASTAEERDAWIEALHEAIEDNASRRSTFLQAKMPMYQSPSTSTLGKQAPVWIPDFRVTMCQQCTAEFTLTFRRHHCRACGKVVCDHCSANRAPLQYKKHQAARVCETCFEILQKDFEHRYGGSSTLDDQNGSRIRRVSSLKAQFKRGVRESGRNRSRKRVPERLMEVCASDTSSQMCGYLRMMVRRSWRRGWFVLKDRVMYEYRAPQDVCALQSIPVLGYDVEAMQKVKEVAEGVDACLAFQLTHPNQQPLVFHADSPHLAEKWIQAMKEAVVLT